MTLEQTRREENAFATLEFSSIGSGNAGKVRAENLLYCDDLVDGLESALKGAHGQALESVRNGFAATEN